MVRSCRVGRLLVHRRRDAVGAEDDDRALGHLVGLLDEDRAAPLEGGDDVLVVDDLLADVDRRAVDLQRPLDGDHRPVDAGAVPPGVGQQDASALISHAPMVGGLRRAHSPGPRGWHRTRTTSRVDLRPAGVSRPRVRGARCGHGS